MSNTNQQVTLQISGKPYTYDAKTTYREVVRDFEEEMGSRIILVKENHRLRELHHKVQESELKLLTMKDTDGYRTFVRSMTFLMLSADYEVSRRESGGAADDFSGITVHFAVSQGLYCTRQGKAVSQEWLDQIEKEMRALVECAAPIEKLSMSTDKAARLFAGQHMSDKQQLMRYRMGSRINLYRMGSYTDYFYGYMVPDASYLPHFALTAFADGFVLRYPTRDHIDEIPAFAPDQKLFAEQNKALQRGALLKTRTVAEVNGHLTQGKGQDMILTMEANQEKEIAHIAERIAGDPAIRFVMIAGPSSSGKTTFSHRLSAQLSTYGLHPYPIEVDSYFKNREDTPKNPDGSYNFECLEAMDVEQFNRDMSQLLEGKQVELPTFNFLTGKREYKGTKVLQLKERDILVIEGIHCLNDQLSCALPKENKFKIYISSLTQLNLDEHNRIPTTDARLIRRMVRDARIRGTSAEQTIAMWASVRAGEEQYIFPYQESADVMFNSALTYELSVLKIYAEPLLFGIDSTSPYYAEARKILKFLDYFVAMPAEQIPVNSIIREFVGGGCFKV